MSVPSHGNHSKGSCPCFSLATSAFWPTLVLPCVARYGIAYPLLLGTVNNNLFHGTHLLCCWAHITEYRIQNAEWNLPFKTSRWFGCAWVAQSVKHPSSAQVMISGAFVNLSPEWGSLLSTQSLLHILSLPLSLPFPHFLFLLKINKI